MSVPSYLKSGDKIAIISTARKVAIEDVYLAIEVFKSWGLEPVLGSNLFETDHQFAGTDYERAKDLIWAFENPEIKAIVCARGGYGTARLIDKIDHKIFSTNPKWLVGFSDITVLLSLLSNYQIPSLHGIMPILFKEEKAAESLKSLKGALFGKKITIEIPTTAKNRVGTTKGILIGGNLSILSNLVGTVADIDTNDKILFIEDLDEYLYHIDRMMLHLKLANKLKGLAGLIVGHFSDLKDNTIPFGKSLADIVLDSVAEYKYPVCFGFPVGHQFPNLALRVGMQAKLEITETSVSFTQQA